VITFYNTTSVVKVGSDDRFVHFFFPFLGFTPSMSPM
jgi:hypothetical protein